MKYVGSVLVAIIICGVFWLVYPAKEQVNQLEKQISSQYFFANYLLRDTVEELIKWNFSQPVTDADEDYLKNLTNSFKYTTGLIFSGDMVHHEWRSKSLDIELYLSNYIYGTSLSAEDVENLKQALQATRFIIIDFDAYYLDNKSDYYNAMHDEKHEMVDKVKRRLATNY